MNKKFEIILEPNKTQEIYGMIDVQTETNNYKTATTNDQFQAINYSRIVIEEVIVLDKLPNQNSPIPVPATNYIVLTLIRLFILCISCFFLYSFYYKQSSKKKGL